ncbi:MAG: GAF domain-containing sensor histidine kinase [Chloroflexota bacterium]|nr:MAG: GAF domain-containing sensor histidine kinase [Chloroflexota bacterium]
MSSISKPKLDQDPQQDLLRVLSLTQWAVPLLMAIIGISYTIFEHTRHIGEPAWPWLTFLGILVLGILGPIFSWLVIHWAYKTAEAYLSSQSQLILRAEELAALNKLSIAASHSLDLDKTISTILEESMTALDAEAGMVFIRGSNNSGLRLEAHRGISMDMAQKEAKLHPGQCLCGQAVEYRKVLFAGNVENDPRCTSDVCICEGFHSIACAPLEVKGELLGLMQLASPEIDHFTNEQTAFMAAVANQVSISIENSRLYERVRGFNVELEQKVNQRTSELEAARWALAEKARQLQRLLNESYRIQEDTQARIARDMHDGVTQTIIGALYETQAARQALIDDPDRAGENLARAQSLLTEVDGEIRRVIYDLHPPVLDMMGLVIALKRLASTFATTFDIDCQVEVEGTPQRLSKETEINIYRIIQAALQNVISHAMANEVRIFFDFVSPSFQVAILDNGHGFNPKTALETPGDHLGILGMKERAEGMGAKLLVHSLPLQGTEVKLILDNPAYLEQ